MELNKQHSMTIPIKIHNSNTNDKKDPRFQGASSEEDLLSTGRFKMNSKSKKYPIVRMIETKQFDRRAISHIEIPDKPPTVHDGAVR